MMQDGSSRCHHPQQATTTATTKMKKDSEQGEILTPNSASGEETAAALAVAPTVKPTATAILSTEILAFSTPASTMASATTPAKAGETKMAVPLEDTAKDAVFPGSVRVGHDHCPLTNTGKEDDPPKDKTPSKDSINADNSSNKSPIIISDLRDPKAHPHYLFSKQSVSLEAEASKNHDAQDEQRTEAKKQDDDDDDGGGQYADADDSDDEDLPVKPAASVAAATTTTATTVATASTTTITTTATIPSTKREQAMAVVAANDATSAASATAKAAANFVVIQQQQKQEERPKPWDVLCSVGDPAKDREYAHYPGNRRVLDGYVAPNKPRFRASGPAIRAEIARQLTLEVFRAGVRFFRATSNQGWEVCSNEEGELQVLRFLSDDEGVVVVPPPVADNIERNHQNRFHDRFTEEQRWAQERLSALGSQESYERQRAAILASLNSSSPAVAPDAATAATSIGGPPKATAVSKELTAEFVRERQERIRAVSGEHSNGRLSQEFAGPAGASPHLNGTTGPFASAYTASSAAPVSVANPSALLNRGGLVMGPPRLIDVVIGQEAILYGQDGNVHLQNLIRANVGEGGESSEMKLIKARAIFARMQRLGSRVLIKERESQSLWYQLSPQEAHDLIFQAINEEEKKAVFLRTLKEQELSRGSNQLLPNRLHGSPAGPQSFSVTDGSGQRGSMLLTATSLLNNEGLNRRGSQTEALGRLSIEPSQSQQRHSAMMDLTDVARLSQEAGAATSSAGLAASAGGGSGNSNLKRALEGTSESMDGTVKPRKYKKRLRQLREEAAARLNAAAKLNSEQQISNNVEKPISEPTQAAQQTSLSSLASTATEDKSIIFRGPIEIGEYDVVLGRGRGNFSNPGNKNLITQFRNNKQKYIDASKRGKSQIARDIVQDIRDKGGRFMKRVDDDTWEMIPDQEAFRKVSHGIRDLRDSERRFEGYQNDSDLSDSDGEKRANTVDAKKDERSAMESAVALENASAASSQSPVVQDASPLDSPSGQVATGDDEAVESSPADDMKPRDKDVVCGRGKALNRHPGNRRMNRIVRKYKYKYRDARDQDEKASIANAVLATVQGNGARFLKCDSSGDWQELQYKVALKKVYHSIRDSLYNEDLKPRKDSDGPITDDEYSSSDRRRSSGSIEGLQSIVDSAQIIEAGRRGLSSVGAPGNASVPSHESLVLAARQQQAALTIANAEHDDRMRLGLGGLSSLSAGVDRRPEGLVVSSMFDGRTQSLLALERDRQRRELAGQILPNQLGGGMFQLGTGLQGIHVPPTEMSEEQLRRLILSRYGS